MHDGVTVLSVKCLVNRTVFICINDLNKHTRLQIKNKSAAKTISWNSLTKTGVLLCQI